MRRTTMQFCRMTSLLGRIPPCLYKTPANKTVSRICDVSISHKGEWSTGVKNNAQCPRRQSVRRNKKNAKKEHAGIDKIFDSRCCSANHVCEICQSDVYLKTSLLFVHFCGLSFASFLLSLFDERKYFYF